MSESAQTIVFYCVCVFMPLEIVPEILVRLQFAQHKFLITNHGCLACDMLSENWRLNDGVVVLKHGKNSFAKNYIFFQ